MGNITTAKSRSDQAAIMASTGQAITDSQVKAFDRYLAILPNIPTPALPFTPCPHMARNGHITPEAAAQCGQALALEALASLPADMDQAAKLARVQVQVVTKARFKCTKGCTFGHGTLSQAEACSQGSQAKAAKALKDSIQVTTSGSLSDLLAAPRAIEAPAPAPAPKATPKAKATPKPRLRSGSQGSTAKA